MESLVTINNFLPQQKSFAFNIFNVDLLNQSTQNFLFLNFLTNFVLITLACTKVYHRMSNISTVNLNQHEFFLKSFFESFVTCNVLKNCMSSQCEQFYDNG